MLVIAKIRSDIGRDDVVRRQVFFGAAELTGMIVTRHDQRSPLAIVRRLSPMYGGMRCLGLWVRQLAANAVPMQLAQDHTTSTKH